MDTGTGMIEAAGVDPLRNAYEALSDLGNGRRLLARARGRLMHSTTLGWLAWTGSHWSAEAGAMLARQLAHETADAIRGEAEAMKAEADRLAAKGGEGIKAEAARERADSLYGWAIQAGNGGRVNGMMAEAQPYMQVGQDDLDADRMAISAANATLLLRATTGDVLDIRARPHDPADLITRVTAAAYEPGADCPGWRAHIAQVQPDPEMAGFLQRCLGYAITGMTGEQCYFMLQGPGRDGKSTTMSVIRRVLGGYGAAPDVKTFLEGGQRSGADASPDLARLAGDVRLAVCSEPPRGAKLNEGLIKLVTGGEPLTARHLNRDPFEYRPRYKLFILVNGRPRIRGDDDGIWRRTVVIPFPVQIDEALIDRGLEDRLVETEAPGILNWLLEGAAMWHAEGLWRPDEVKEAVADYRASSNPFGEWFVARCERDPLASTPSADLYKDYQEWCEAASIEPVSHTAFGNALGDRQIIRQKDRLGRIRRRGVRLRIREDDMLGRDGGGAPQPGI